MKSRLFGLFPVQYLAAWLVTSISLTVTSAPLYGAADKLVVYAELEEAANYPDGSQTPVPIGPAYDIVRAVLDEAGLEADVRVVPWTRVIHSLNSQKNVLGFSMTRTADREPHYHWIGLLRPIKFKLWTLPDRAAEFPDTLEQARDLRISAERNDVVEKHLIKSGFSNLVYLSQESNTLTMLRRNRIDMMPYIESGMSEYLARKNEPPTALVPVYDLEEISTGHYLVMSKESDPELIEQLTNAYQLVVEKGEFDHLINPDQD